MKTLIKNGIVCETGEQDFVYSRKDLLLQDDIIINVAEKIEDSVDKTIDATDCLLIPGLINCHHHSHDNFNKGLFDNTPLETWMVQVRPFFSGLQHSKHQIYYRTIITAMEMLKSGTTTVMDDVFLSSPTDTESLDIIIKAYEDIGMRAVVCPHVKNIPMEKTIPYLEEVFTDEMKAVTNMPLPSEGEILDFLEEKISQYNQADRLVTMGIAPSAPQRCSVELLQGIKRLALTYNIPVVSHILETYVQKETGILFYNKSLLKYLGDLDLLYPGFVSIHSVWVDDQDIELLERHGCHAVHNPTCNMKMGSGVAPVGQILQKIAMGLGTDNISANDSANLFEAMKNAVLLSKLKTPDMSQWLPAHTGLKMSTVDGAKCVGKATSIGSLSPGKKADITILDLNNERFATAHDYTKALVYAENGKSVKTVLVDGKIVVEDGHLVSVDESKILDNIREIMPEVQKEHELAMNECKDVLELCRSAYDMCNSTRT